MLFIGICVGLYFVGCFFLGVEILLCYYLLRSWVDIIFYFRVKIVFIIWRMYEFKMDIII